MQLGISLASSTRLAPAEAGRHLIARARAAAEAGLDSMSLGDSHANGGGYLQNTPSLGRLLPEWSGRPVGCLFLVPMWPPVLVAEQIGTLAALHDGPFIVQTAMGGSEIQYAALGRSRDHRVTVFEESVRIIVELLAGHTVSSEQFGFDDLSLGLAPERPVEWWMGSMNDAGVERAARFGAAWYALPGASIDDLAPMLETYRSACDRADTRARTMVRRDVVVLADGDRARRLADEAVAGGYRGMARSALVVGTPEDAAEHLARFGEAGVDQIVARTMGLDPEVDLETIDLLADVRRMISVP